MDALFAWHALGVPVVVVVVITLALTRSRLAFVAGLLGSAYVLFWGTWLVADMMTGVGINQSVLFHFFSGTRDADYSQFSKEIAVFVCFVALALAILVASFVVSWHSRRRRTEKPPRSGLPAWLPVMLCSLLVGGGWLVSPWHRDLMALSNTYTTLDEAERQRLEALYDIDERRISADKNLVVLYLESVEATYFNEILFPDLLPNLRELREESAHFTGIAQSPGAGWTIAGLVNTQCGLPLATPGAGDNEMGKVKHFLPKAKCLAEYLRDSGFHTVYMGGASGEFAGKDRFLRQHGFSVVRDKTYFKQWQHQENEFSGWGAYDDELLDSVYQEFVTLSQQKAPFALFALTMDTHHPHGHVSPSCEGIDYGRGEYRTLNALHCADQLVGRFIDRVRASPFYEDTTLVVLSDHLAMVNDAKPLIDKAARRDNLLMIFDSRVPAGERQVKGTMLDVGATLLSVMKADNTRLGFGRSLLAARNAEEGAYTQAYHAGKDVTPYLSFSRDLWAMPNVAGQIQSEGENSVVLGDNTFEAPFFSVLSDSGRVVELYFHDFAQHIENLKHGARYLYAQQCEQERDATPGLCLVSGLKGVGEKVFSTTELMRGINASDIL